MASSATERSRAMRARRHLGLGPARKARPCGVPPLLLLLLLRPRPPLMHFFLQRPPCAPLLRSVAVMRPPRTTLPTSLVLTTALCVPFWCAAPTRPCVPTGWQAPCRRRPGRWEVRCLPCGGSWGWVGMVLVSSILASPQRRCRRWPQSCRPSWTRWGGLQYSTPPLLRQSTWRGGIGTMGGQWCPSPCSSLRAVGGTPACRRFWMQSTGSVVRFPSFFLFFIDLPSQSCWSPPREPMSRCLTATPSRPAPFRTPPDLWEFLWLCRT